MNYNMAKPITDALLQTINDYYYSFLQQVASSNSLALPGIETVRVSTDYGAKGVAKPAIFIDPTYQEIEDEGVGIVGADMVFDVAIMIDGFLESDATFSIMAYADAFVGMVISDDFMDSQVTHASVKRIDYFPGGTGNQRIALLELHILMELGR